MRSRPQSAPFKNSHRYQLMRWLGSENRGKSNTALTKKQTKSGESQWYMKTAESRTGCLYEVVAQEFARLLIPGQPKTRYATDGIDNEFVVSKAVEGFTTFVDVDYVDLAKNLCDHTYYGLGWVLVAALLMCESDLNLGNIGLNQAANGSRRQVIKIDGDFAFSLNRDAGSVTDSSLMNITAQVIADLPLVNSYSAPRWLHQRAGLERKCSYSEKLHTDPVFRGEVHQAILRALILPACVIKKFASIYCGDNTDEARILSGELQERIEQLRLAVRDNAEFIRYLTSDAAVSELEAYWLYLEGFCTTSKNCLVKLAAISKDTVYIQFNDLRNSLHGIRSTADPSRLTGMPTPVQFEFKTKDDLIRSFPMLARKYWQEESSDPDESRPEIVEKFLAAYREFIEKKAISEAEAGDIVNAAYENNVCCFESIYEILSFKLSADKKQIIPLGFYTRLVGLFNRFSSVEDVENLIRICEEIEAFFTLHERMFARYIFDFDSIEVNSSISSDIGCKINWSNYMKMTRMNFYPKVIHPAFAKILFRLGFAYRQEVLDVLPLDVIRAGIYQKSIFDMCYDDPATAKRQSSIYLPRYVYYEQIKRRVTKLPPEIVSFCDLDELCRFIRSHDQALACVVGSEKYLPYLETRIKQFFMSNPLLRKAFVRDFFLNPDSDYGIHHLRRLRLALMPHGEGKFAVIDADGRRTRSFQSDDDFNMGQIFMSTLIQSVPECISFEEFLHILTMHFKVKQLPLTIYRKMSPDKAKFEEEDWSDALLSVIESTMLSKQIKKMLVLEIVVSGRVKACRLSFGMIRGIYNNFIHSSYVENSENYLRCLSLLTTAVNRLDMIEQSTAVALTDLLNYQLEPGVKIEPASFEEMLMSLLEPATIDSENAQLVQAMRKFIDAISERINPVDTPPIWQPRPM